MSTTWAQTAGEICRSALELMGVISAVETPSAEDTSVCMRALNGLLKELPSLGYLWPEYRTGVAVSWTSGAVVTLPTDYHDFPLMRRADGEILRQLTAIEWANMDAATRAQTAEKPSAFFVQGTSATLWPVPTTAPGLVLDYLSIISDAAANAQPDMPQSWHHALGWGVASECWLKFSVPAELGAQIDMKWQGRASRLLAMAAENAPIEFTVAD